MSNTKSVSAATVREWAKGNLDKIDAAAHVSILGSGASKTGTVRGRLHPEAITAYNRANKGRKYVLGTPNEASLIVQQIVVESKSGRKVPRKVTLTVEQVRTLTGHTKAGRIPDAVKREAAFKSLTA